jgi:predicted DNA-binding transcriptional regulator AlpA
MKLDPKEPNSSKGTDGVGAVGPHLTPLLVGTQKAASILGLSTSTLEKWRFYNTPDTPPVVRIGRACRYRLTDLEKWVARLDNAKDPQASGPVGD